MSLPTTPPGWYPDPAAVTSSDRYWDGRTWTAHTRPTGKVGTGGAYGTWPAQGTGAPAWGTYPAAAPHWGAASQQTNGFAIASIVCSIASLLTFGLGAVLGVVFGHVALHQMRTSGESGRGLAIAGLVVGYTFLALAIILLIVGVVAVSHTTIHNNTNGTTFSLGRLMPVGP